jgi:hypothetical protein
MELDQRKLEDEYGKLLACRSEAKRLVENINALLPESDRFSADRREEPLGDLIKDARNKAIRAVLRPLFESSNVNIDVNEISKTLDKQAPRYFAVDRVMTIFRSKYDTAKDELKAQFLKEADLLLPYRGINSPEDMYGQGQVTRVKAFSYREQVRWLARRDVGLQESRNFPGETHPYKLAGCGSESCSWWFDSEFV